VSSEGQIEKTGFEKFVVAHSSFLKYRFGAWLEAGVGATEFHHNTGEVSLGGLAQANPRRSVRSTTTP
jgi:hypothetical protein